MSTGTFVLILLFVGSLLWAWLFGGRLPRPFRGRGCQGKGWREAFPKASKQEIREFLRVFVSAFAFDESEILKLSPNDQILAIYRGRYPVRGMADALELETLMVDVQKRYGVEFETIWHEQLTLGELFAKSGQASSGASK
jgi:propanediol dehydratase small subunit